MTEEMIQAMAFEAAKIQAAKITTHMEIENLAATMYQNYTKALEVIREQIKQEEIDLNFDSEEFAKNSARFK